MIFNLLEYIEKIILSYTNDFSLYVENETNELIIQLFNPYFQIRRDNYTTKFKIPPNFKVNITMRLINPFKMVSAHPDNVVSKEQTEVFYKLVENRVLFNLLTMADLSKWGLLKFLVMFYYLGKDCYIFVDTNNSIILDNVIKIEVKNNSHVINLIPHPMIWEPKDMQEIRKSYKKIIKHSENFLSYLDYVESISFLDIDSQVYTILTDFNKFFQKGDIV